MWQDSTAIAVCHVARARQHRTFRDWARKSKNGMGWWYGFKLHVQCDEAGRLCGVGLMTIPYFVSNLFPLVAMVMFQISSFPV